MGRKAECGTAPPPLVWSKGRMGRCRNLEDGAAEGGGGRRVDSHSDGAECAPPEYALSGPHRDARMGAPHTEREPPGRVGFVRIFARAAARIVAESQVQHALTRAWGSMTVKQRGGILGPRLWRAHSEMAAQGRWGWRRRADRRNGGAAG